LLECVTLDGVRSHQAALQEIADANNGHRTSGAPGFDASVAYAQQVLSDAGYLVTLQPFQFQTFISLSPSVLEQVTPAPAGPIANSIFSYSGSGDVTAPVSTTTRTSASSRASASASRTSRCIAAVKLLSRSGRFSVSVATPSLDSYRMCS